MANTIIIGDIHGCLTEFEELVYQAVRPGDRVICLGDLLDKGPDPVGCLQYARHKGFESVLGNHEDWHLRWRKHEIRRKRDGYGNPMRPKDQTCVIQNEALSDEDITWMWSLPKYLVVGSWVVVHGGLVPGLPLDQQDPTRIIRLRWLDEENNHIPVDYANPPPSDVHHWSTVYDGDLNVVYGHEPCSLSEPQVTAHHRADGREVQCIDLDTGCVHGGRLTAFVLEKGYFVQVKARRCYAESVYPIPA